MNKQVAIIVGILVIVAILSVVVISNKDDDGGIPRGTSSTLGEVEKATTTPEVPDVVVEEPKVEEDTSYLNDEMANVDGIEVMNPEDLPAEPPTPPTPEVEEVPNEPAPTETEDVVEEETPTEEPVVEVPEEPVVIEEPEVVLGSLVAHYTFSEGVGVFLTDLSGYENNGTLINTEDTIWQTGTNVGSIKFDGINDYAKIPHSDSLNVGAIDQSYSISFWFEDDTKPSGERQILGKGARSGPSPFIFRLDDNGKVSLRISDGFEAKTIESNSSIVSGGWRHVVGVRDVSTDRIRLYRDGAETGGIVYDTTRLDVMNTLDIVINKHDEGTTYLYDVFFLDDLRIYNHALQPDEISSLFTEGRTAN